jgi:hypothetical protein
MSNLWMEIEALVLDGVPLNSVQGQRLAQLTEIALTRLLEQRGTSTRLGANGDEQEKEMPSTKPATMNVPANANEARWAEEIALVIYRAMDRTL